MSKPRRWMIRFTEPMQQAVREGRKTETRRVSQKWMRLRVGDELFVPRTDLRMVVADPPRRERLQDISEASAIAEGLFVPEAEYAQNGPRAAANAFRCLWDSINGDEPGRAWADNPEVTVVTFRRIA